MIGTEASAKEQFSLEESRYTDSYGARHSEYWLKELEGSSPARFFPDKATTIRSSQSTGIQSFTLEAPIYQSLNAFCKQHEVLLSVALLTAFRATHYRFTGVDDATIASSDSPIEGGNDSDMRYIRIKIHDQPFANLVQQVQSTLLAAKAHRNVSWEELNEKKKPKSKGASRTAFADVALFFAPRSNSSKPASEHGPLTYGFDLETHLNHDNNCIKGHIAFSPDVFELESIKIILSVFKEMLKQAIDQPMTAIPMLPLQNCTEGFRRTRTLDYHQTKYPRNSSVIDVFQGQVASYPHVVAVKDNTTWLTYAQLDYQSDSVAQWLVSRPGYAAETLVGVLASRCCQTIVVYLGILKANLAYLPLDIGNPASRIESILSSVNGNKLLFLGPGTQDSMTFASVLQRKDVESFAIAEAIRCPPSMEERHSHKSIAYRAPSATSLAYVMFTSGSTGRPKGVMAEHRGIVRLAVESNVSSQLSGSVAHMSNTAFDASTWEIYTGLLNGRTVVCIDTITVLDTALLEHTLNSQNVRTAFFTPALLKTYLLEAPQVIEALDIMFLGGERVDPADAFKARDLTKLISVYGPTENTVYSTIYCTPRSESYPNGVPIGRAVSNSGAYVMDTLQRLVPDGVVGELVVTGDGLARGYTDPKHNYGRFVEVHIEGQRGLVRAYRTGDYVRRRPIDGQLEFIGRMDHQVKVRGHRIELSEVEQALYTHNAVSNAVAVACEQRGGGKELVGFVTLHQEPQGVATGARGSKHDPIQTEVNGDETLSNSANTHIAPNQHSNRETEEDIHDKVRQILPSYMVPTRISVIDRIPVNENGKVDHAILSSSFYSRQRGKKPNTFVAPRNDIERIIVEEFTRILEYDIGITESFFDRGGHSLLATRVVPKINKRLDACLSIADIFNHPRIIDLAEHLTQSGKIGGGYNPISHEPNRGPTELSFAQGRLWFLDRLYPNSDRYLLPFAVRLRGPLSYSALNEALLAVQKRHETLRTVFEERNGIALQIVRPFQQRKAMVVEVPCAEKSRLIDRLREEKISPFDLQTEPGWRCVVYKLSNEDHVLSVIMHHIVSDGWSVDILRRELMVSYSAAIRGEDPLTQLPALPIQYQDYTIWEREPAQVLEYTRQLQYWIRQLEGSKPAELFCDKPRPSVFSSKANLQPLKIDGLLYDELQAFCALYQVTPFVVLLSVFRATHFRLTRVDDATIGCPNANRRREELQDLIGFFVNFQCIRLRIEDKSFLELVCHVRASVLAAFENQDVPFERIVAELHPESRDSSRNPLVQLAFALHGQRNLGEFTLEGLDSEPIENQPTTRFDLEFHLYQGESCFYGHTLFATELFESQTIATMVSVFYQVLEQALKEPEQRIASLWLPDSSKMLQDMNLLKMQRIDYPHDLSIIDIFRQQVADHPHKTALKDSTCQLTYAQLDHLSQDVARWLASWSLAPETLVGVLAARSCKTVIAYLGIMKANLAYLPLDVSNPPSRIETILSSVKGEKLVLLGSAVHTTKIQREDVKLVSIAEVIRMGASQQALITSLPSATSLAYVMFTSGSTGRPKGVMAEHRGIVRLTRESNVVCQLPKTGNIAHISNIAFDGSTWEIYTALLNGRTAICIDSMTVLDTMGLYEAFVEHDVQAAFITPALLKPCLAQQPAIISKLHTMYLGGERVDPQDAFRVRELLQGRLISVYGPTENTVYSTLYPTPEDEKYVNGVPIGLPVSNSGAYVMDSELRLVPPGVIGELIVTGDGVARGYTDPERNRDRFIEVEIEERLTRAYRTGDYVRYRPTDGQLEFIGRIDHQVKVRGHRVELAEIEQALLDHPSIDNSVVIIQDGQENQDLELIGFVTMHQDFEMVTQEKLIVDQHEETQVDGWKEFFDVGAYIGIDTISSEKLGRDFLSWTSMYDGSTISEPEMTEWLDDTLNTMLNGEQPGNVVEVGTGTGMILFNIKQGLTSYVGLEPAKSAVKFVTHAAKSIPAYADKVQVRVGTALDLNSEDFGSGTDLVVFNSVIQYFPSRQYLRTAIEKVLRLQSTKRIFIGDIRSHSLYRQFQVSKALHHIGQSASKDDFVRQMAEAGRVEEELLVDPAFFTQLLSQYPELVSHVEVVPKKMRATNELSCYRFGVVIHAIPREGKQQSIHDVNSDKWIDFIESGLDKKAILNLLRSSSSSNILAVSNIPHSKTILERHIIDSIDSKTEEEANTRDWLSSIIESSSKFPSLSAIDLEEIAELSGFQVEISWARQFSQRGGLDAVFYRPLQGTERMLFRFPNDHHGRAPDSFTNQPLEAHMKIKTERDVREWLRAKVPSYMVPSTIKLLDKMPLNENGKVDRQALQKNAQTNDQKLKVSSSRVAPRTELELALHAEFSQVLDREFGVTDGFFELGGHSLMATRVVSKINKRLNIHLTVADIFEQPTIAGLAEKIHQTRADDEYIPIPRAQSHESVEQSFAQRRLWFLYRLYPKSERYMFPFAVRLRGSLDLVALNNAIHAVTSRHEITRTIYFECEGKAMQMVQPFQPQPVPVIKATDRDALFAALRQEQTRPFELEQESGWRFTGFSLDKDDFILSIVMHHISYDGWSLPILQRELTLAYSAAIRGHDLLSINQLAPLPIQYRDYAIWEKQEAQKANFEQQLDYWTKHLEGSQPAELPCDRRRPPVFTGVAETQEFMIEGALYDSLQNFCAEQQITPFVALLAAFRGAHYRLTGVEDATLGTPNAGRNREELQNLIGFFVNIQAIRVKIPEDLRFTDLVQEVKSTVLAAIAHQDVPFESIVAKLQPGRDASRNPLVQICFAVHSQLSLGGFELEGTEAEQVDGPTTTRFDVEMHLYQGDKRFHGNAVYSSDLYDARTISNMVSIFLTILEQVLRNPWASIRSLDLTSGSEAISNIGPDFEMGKKVEYPRDSSVVSVFQQQVALCPSAIAVKDTSDSTLLSYAQLDYKSDVLSRWLISRGFPSETIIGTYAPRSCHAIVAYMGILKANMAYLPLDISSPTSRINTILSSLSGKKLVLVGRRTKSLKPRDDVDLFFIDDVLRDQMQAEEKVSGQRASFIPPRATSLAYVMFTSGSTGKPKGVMLEHRGILRLAKSDLTSQLPGTGSIAHIANTAFDASVLEIYTALLSGRTVVCFDHMTVLDPVQLGHRFKQEDVRIALFSPTLLNQCLIQSPETVSILHTLFIGGERLDLRDTLRARGLIHGNVYNAYGPTENTVVSTFYPIVENDAEYVGGIPIGRSISNSGAFIVDVQQQLVPIGVVGELVVTGDGLARGYTNIVNHDRFVQIKVSGETLRAYRTGDLARYRPIDGQLEFLGRLDHQVKIRGNRIELAEVEQALLSWDCVASAVAVVVHEQDGQERKIASFVTVLNEVNGSSIGSAHLIETNEESQTKARMIDQSHKTITKQLRDFLRNSLPSYMVPNSIVIVEKMPVNENGKIDRQFLSMSFNEKENTPTSSRTAPRDDIERAICEEFSEILERDIDPTESFFDLGGHSLMVASIVYRINKRLKSSITVLDFFQSPVPTTLRDRITPQNININGINRIPPHVEKHSRQGSRATLVLVHGFWGQGRIFSKLQSFIDVAVDVVVFHDPFFGNSSHPESLKEWARTYVEDLQELVPSHHTLIFGGFSFGGLIAFEMALQWRKMFGMDPASLLLLDASTYPLLDSFFEDQSQLDEEIGYAVRVFGDGWQETLHGHVEQMKRLVLNSTDLSIYSGRCLYLMTPEAYRGGAGEWWVARCPQLEAHHLDCAHHDLLGESIVESVGNLIQNHIGSLLEEID